MTRTVWAPWAFRTFAVVGVALFVASSLAVATDSDSDGIPDDVEAYTARNMVAGDTGSSFFIRSRSVGAAQDDVFEVSYSGGEFSVSYAPGPSSQETVWYRIEFRRLQEYAPEDGGGLKETGTRMDLTPENATVTMSNATTADGERQVRFRITYATNPPGLFTVTVGASERFSKVDGGLVSPVEAKVDLGIHGWSWSSEATVLGLEVDVYADGATVPVVDDRSGDEEHGWASDERQVNVTRVGDTAFFSWASTALVDGVSRPVQATPLEPRGEGYDLSLLYERPAGAASSTIVHDPKMGVESSALWSAWNQERPAVLSPDLALYALGVGAIAAVVAATVLVRRRRKAE